MRKRVKVGAAFSDFVYTEHTNRKRNLGIPVFGNFGVASDVHWRTSWVIVLCIIASVLLLGRLFFLQVMQGSNYRLLSDSNRIRTTIIHAPRGVIFDRNGKPLVYNIPGFRQVINGKTTLIDEQTGISLLAQGKQLSIDSLRSYPYKDAMSHVIGYVGQISPEELSDPLLANYQPDDVIGKMGIEQSYESLLKGIDGQKLTEVDATGKTVRTLGETDPIAGQNVTLTLDADLQQQVYSAMSSVQKGAAIVSKPDGEILAMVSKPSFDPNLFTLGPDYHIATTSGYTNVSSILLDGDNQPLLNRAIAGVYPPGSTFKLVVAAAGLQDNVIDSNFMVDDTGILKVGDFSFANWYYTQYGRTEGSINVVTAIKRSNDIFFYTLGNMLGIDRLAAFGQQFGLGQKLGIDLLGEQPGLMPTKEWKQKVIGEPWYLGDNYHIGIGQGYLLTTPLQVNTWTQAIANEGTLFQPHLLLSVAQKNNKPVIKSQNLLNLENFNLIRQGMIEACNTGGVAWPLFNFRIKNQESRIKVDGLDFYEPPEATSSAQSSNEVGVAIACKTGTAQHGSEDTLPHAWITVFAPAYHPQIIVTVLSESSGEGSNVAGPIAKEILEDYFSK